MNAQAPAATAPVEDPAPVNFHVGLAVDPQCLDWKTITAQLEYALSNRVASGNTIVFHDLTGWWTTRIALLWAVGNGHRVDYTPSEIHRIEHSEIKRLDALHAEGQMHALVVFHNDTTSNRVSRKPGRRKSLHLPRQAAGHPDPGRPLHQARQGTGSLPPRAHPERPAAPLRQQLQDRPLLRPQGHDRDRTRLALVLHRTIRQPLRRLPARSASR